MEATNADLMEMMQNMMDKMTTKFDECTNKVDECSQKVDQLASRLSHLEKNVEAMNHQLEDKATHKSVHSIVEGFSQSTTALMCFNNPYHIVFYGIQSQPPLPVEELFKRFMVEKLHIDEGRAYNMPMIVQRFSSMSQTEAAPLCVIVRSPKDTHLLQQQAKSAHKQLLKEGIWAKWAEYVGHGMLGLKKSTR